MTGSDSRATTGLEWRPAPPLATPSRADRGFSISPVNYWDVARPLSTLDTLRTDLNVGRGRLQHHLGPKSSFFATALQISPIPTAATTPLHHFSKSDPTLQLGSSYSSSLNSPLAFDLYPPATHLLNTPFICELTPSSATLQFKSLDTSSSSSLTLWASELVQILHQTCLPPCLQVLLSHLPNPMAVLPLTTSPPTTTSDDSKLPREHSVLPPHKPSSTTRQDVLSSK